MVGKSRFAGSFPEPDSWFHDYLTTKKADAYWTVVPILDENLPFAELPGPDSITLQNNYYLKHANSGRYVTQVYKQPAEKWYPTLGSGDRVKLYTMSGGTFSGLGASLGVCDGMPLRLVNYYEDLDYSGKRCDVLVAFDDRKSLYYYYGDCTRENQTWMISLVTGFGLLKSGSRVRLVNEKFGQFMAPYKGPGSTFYLTTVTEYTTECDWLLEKA